MHDNSIRHVVKDIPLLIQQAFDLFELQKVDFGVLFYVVANIVDVKDITGDVGQVVAKEITVISVDYGTGANNVCQYHDEADSLSDAQEGHFAHQNKNVNAVHVSI